MNRDKQPKHRQPLLWVYLLTAFALTILLGFSNDVLAQSQWTTNGNNINNTNTGNVGIGTTTPAASLNIYHNDIHGSGIRIDNAASTGTYKYGILIQAGPSGHGVTDWPNATVLEGTAGGGLVLSGYEAPIKFQTNLRTTRMIINNSGNVGIGTTSPDKLFTVEGVVPSLGGAMSVFRTTGSNNGAGLLLDATGSGNNNLAFSRNGTNKAGLAWDNSRNFLGFVNVAYSPTDFSLRLNSDGSLTYHDGASSAERFRIAASGSVGIGTTGPAYRLDVQGGQINTSGGLCIAGDCRTSWSQVADGSSLTNLNASNITTGRSTTRGSALCQSTKVARA